MHGYELTDFEHVEFSVAMTAATDDDLAAHFGRFPPGVIQEDLTFAYWQPSRGAVRYTAILQRLALPRDDERLLQGNVAFTAAYLARVLDELPPGSGIALLHSHLGPGWQAMSEDDVVAERDRLAGVVASTTGLPLLGLTWSTDRIWSARVWLRAAKHRYERRWATTIRSAGQQLHMSYHPELRPAPGALATQVATRSVWGDRAQQDLARTHVGIIGLGSVGSIVAEALSRTGIEHLTLIDHDIIEARNLDRTLGATTDDVDLRTLKVAVSDRVVQHSHTSERFEATTVAQSVLEADGLAHALDCDVLISCVDRPWPRHVLNVLAYSHLIPVIDGGILARVDQEGRLLHVDWRIHSIGPGRACLYCIDALLRSDVALDRDGMLDNIDYIQNLSHAERERYQRRNVFAFSLSVASHEVLQLVGLVSGNKRVGGSGPQTYHAYPGIMEVKPTVTCADDCDVQPLTASATRLF